MAFHEPGQTCVHVPDLLGELADPVGQQVQGDAGGLRHRLLAAGSRQIRPDSFAGPACVALCDGDGELRARDLAAVLHAAFKGDLEPLARAVPPAS